MSDMVRQRELLNRAALSFPTPAGRYVLDRGRWFVSQPRPTGVRKGADKACYRNAGRYVLDHPEYRYVEGFAMSTELGMVVQHAWAADSIDRVIDRTWKHPEESLYFGVSFDAKTWATVMTLLGRDTDSLFHDGTVPSAIKER